MAAKKTLDIQAEDVLAGISAVISINAVECEFSSQAKVKLGGKELGDAIYNSLVREFNKLIGGMTEEQKEAVTKKIVNNAKIRQAAEVAKATKRKSVRSNNPANLPSNLKDCLLAGKSEYSELYICVTGDTKVMLADGSSEEIQNLVGKENVLVQSYDGEKPITANMLRAFETQKVKKTLRITMEDGSVFECTPAHRLLSNGDWHTADEFSVGDEIDNVKEML